LIGIAYGQRRAEERVREFVSDQMTQIARGLGITFADHAVADELPLKHVVSEARIVRVFTSPCWGFYPTGTQNLAANLDCLSCAG